MAKKMDIEKLEKLNELKEKGILSQEEFDIQKTYMLNEDMISQNNYFENCSDEIGRAHV